MKNFLIFLFHILLVVAGIVQSGYALHTHEAVCIHTLTPPTNARGVNRMSRNSDAPLYRLHFSENIPSDGRHVGPETYHVQVSIENELLAFDTAKILVSAQGSCGTGSLKFDQDDFIEVKQKVDSCPRLLHTANKTPMTGLPTLLWTPPSCGCVVFKVLVVEEANIYFADNEETKNGPLTQTVCVEKRVTREHFLEALCMAPDRHRSSQILSNSAFLARHSLDSKKMDRYGVEMALELRRSDNKICCNKVKHKEKMNCFDNIRRHRIDRFCGDGIPDLNFVTFRSNFMRDREQHCCFILGEHRYQCFGANSDLKSGTNETYLDYSMDDTDPANDLAIFILPKDSDVLQLIRSVVFGKKRDTEDNTDTSGKHGGRQTSGEDNPKSHGQTTHKSKTEDGSLSPVVTKVMSSVSSEVKDKPKQGEGRRRDTRPGDLLPADTAGVEPVSSTEVKGNRRRGGSATETKKGSQEEGDLVRNVGRQWGSGEKTGRPTKRKDSGEKPLRSGGLSRDVETDQRGAGRASTERRVPGWTSERVDTEIIGDNILAGNFEDEGGSSIERTLIMYERRMEKLRLKTVCCKAGMNAGKFVYSVTKLRARNECGHSGEKYLSRSHLDSGMRTCKETFMKCCMEKADKGPSMTSDEFRASPYMRFDNPGKTVDDVPKETVMVSENEEEDREQTPDVEGTANEREASTMRTRGDSIFELQGKSDGPSLFDKMDNAEESVEAIDRAEPTPEKKVPHARGDEEIDAYDERDFGTEDSDDELYSIKGQKTVKNKAFKGRDSKKESREKTGFLSPVAHHPRGSNNYRGGSQGGSSMRTKGMNPRLSRPKQAREGASTEQRPGYTVYNPRAQLKDRQTGAMDSKEMVAAHGKSFTRTLDSKEMAEAFDRQEIMAPSMSGAKKKRRHLRQKK